MKAQKSLHIPKRAMEAQQKNQIPQTSFSPILSLARQFCVLNISDEHSSMSVEKAGLLASRSSY